MTINHAKNGLNQALSDSMLAAHLAAHGVRHLRAVTTQPISQTLSPLILIAELARHPAPRFREALIPLFLRHPDYAEWVPELVASLEAPAADVLRHMYTVAVYLQRLWRGVLGLYLGTFPLLPDYFGQAYFGLPAPDEHFGEAGLRALAELFQVKTGYEWRSAYESVMSLLLKQLSLDKHQHEHRIN